MAVIESIRPAATESDLGYGQLFAVLVRRRFWFLGAFLAVLPFTLFYAFTREPVYQSSMQLLVEPNYQGKRDENLQSNQFADLNVNIDYATQLNLMRSSQLLQQAVDQLQTQYPDLTISDIQGSLTLTRLVEKGATKDGVETKIVQATYVSNDSVKSKNILEAIQKVYQNYNLAQQRQRLQEGLSFINNQLPEARTDVATAEGALKEFREEQNVIDPTQQATGFTQALLANQQQQDDVQGQLKSAQARFDALQDKLGHPLDDALISARLSQSTRYQNLLNQLQATELELEKQRTLYSDRYPTVKRLLDQQQRQLGLLQEEVGRVLGGTPTSANLFAASPSSTNTPSTNAPTVSTTATPPVSASTPSDNLLTQGQFGATDLGIVGEMVAARTEVASLEARSRSLKQAEQDLRQKLDRFPNLIAEYDRLQPGVEINRDSLKQLLSARQELGIELARGGFKWQVVEPPAIGVKTAPSLARNIAVGIVIGIFLGGATAFIRESMDDSVHSSDQLKQKTVLPLLGVIPELSQLRGEGSLAFLPFNRTESLFAPASQMLYLPTFRESLDLIHKNIQLLEATAKSLVVTSALPGEGKSTLALGLAFSAARSHQRVLLIDADLRHPSIHQRLGLPNEVGLSTMLADRTQITKPQAISLLSTKIHVLTAGPIPDDPVKLLSSRWMQELLAKFGQIYDLVLLDAPPILGLVDAIQIASYCQGVVMVGRINRVTQSELSQAMGMLSQLKAIGIVANGAKEYRNNYFSYGYRDGNFNAAKYESLARN